jgi:hypothetical protein
MLKACGEICVSHTETDAEKQRNTQNASFPPNNLVAAAKPHIHTKKKETSHPHAENYRGGSLLAEKQAKSMLPS